MTDETWKIIKDFPNYHISNKGRVKSWQNRGLFILKPIKLPVGYLFVNLCNEGKRQAKRIHRLVLEAFVGSCPDGLQANHKDGDKQNNDLTNLEWITQSENIRHGHKMGLYKSSPWRLLGEQHPGTKLKAGEVWLIKRLLWFEYPQRRIAKMFKVTKGAIQSISMGYSWRHVEFEPTDKDREHYKRSMI